MENIKSFGLNELPLNDLEWVNDLLYFDGPFLSQLRRREHEYYLKLWCDCNDEYNRWMYFKVYEKDRLRLIAGEKSLYDCLINGPDSFVFFTDESEKSSLSYVVEIEKIPDSYVPKVDSFLELDESLIGEDNSAFIFEDDWDMEALRNLYRKYVQVFNFNYVLDNGGVVNANFHWQDGASYKHFYDRIKNLVPANDACGLESVSYASPGYMKISCDRKISEVSLEKVNSYIKFKSDVDSNYSELYNEIRSESYNRISFDAAVSQFKGNKDCQDNLDALLGLLLTQDEKEVYVQQFKTEFVQAKVIMGYKRRLSELAAYFISKDVRAVSKAIKIDLNPNSDNKCTTLD